MLQRIVAKLGRCCFYCGDSDAHLTDDHFVPKYLGGNPHEFNIVPACGVCNSIKGRRSFKEARWRLVLKRIGWPKFTLDQLDWLRASGFDMLPYDNGKLACETLTVDKTNGSRPAVYRAIARVGVISYRMGR